MSDGERTARERVEALYEATDRLTPEDLRMTPMPVRDAEVRERLVAHLEDAAARADRGQLLGEARSWLREAIGARTLARYHPEAGVWGIPAGGLVSDRVEVFLALEDAVSVAATEDLLDPAEAAELADPGRQLLRLDPLLIPGVAPAPAAPSWEPSPADWAAAGDHGPAAVDPDEAPVGGSTVMRRVFFGTLGAFAAVAALFAGLVGGQPVLGILGAIAAVAVAWTFATYRSAWRP